MTESLHDTPADHETPFTYVGQELDHFRLARNWKDYWFQHISQYLGRDVLEVGAGLGNNTEVLFQRADLHLTALEPDPALVRQHREVLERLSPEQRNRIELITGTVDDLPADRQFDAILYIDVLEHIEHDAAQVLAALPHLRPGGRLIILSPAFMQLYSPFDQALGHYRRYTLRTLAAIVPPSLRERKLIYLDCVAFLLSISNRLLLRQSVPKASQVRLWDRVFVPLSRVLDPLFSTLVGRSVLGIWEKS
jgi:ubiquinone/menaquinone biosynthesis C-methylase UbiE